MSIWKMIYDLEYWIHIGTGGDIVSSPDNRKEFQHIVSELKYQKIPDERIPAEVVTRLKQEARKPFYKRATFWHLVKLSLKKLVGRR